ncbi:MAG: arginine--tRNA ligase [Lactobacillales bacterium]|nr:arginine--tRNA ligase [Lactobacillales bacterium]
MNEKDLVTRALATALNGQLALEEIKNLLENPKSAVHGDVAFPAFFLAKILRKAPNIIASELAAKITADDFEKIEVVGPYINFFMNKKKVSAKVLQQILSQGTHFGDFNEGDGRNIVIDMSSPNIAKPFSIGHLRSTVIGDALANIFAKLDYNPVRINHLGDWGKQFGMLITAYKKWGKKEAVKAHPIDELLKLYVRINAEAKVNPTLDEEAREWFLKLERGDQETYKLWQWFRDESLIEFNRLYKQLDVSFDSINGEAFYNDKMAEVVDILESKGLLKVSKGATIVDLEKYDLNPALIKKADGATLYITRDLAAALFRKRKYDFAKCVYVVGQEQASHFKQLKAVLKEMGYSWADDVYHVPFGLVTKDGKKLSTRKGNVILLEATLHEADKRALKQIDEKKTNLSNKEQVAHAVGTGAVKFFDLKTDRMNGYDFNLEAMVSFEGETGPYVQYTHARSMSILRKADFKVESLATYALKDAESWEIIKLLQAFPQIVQRSADRFEPSIIAKYTLQLSQSFNKYYAHVRILDENEEKSARLTLVYAVATVLKEALRILGVDAPDEM